MKQAGGWPNPFGPIEDAQKAKAMSRLTTVGFGLWAGVGLIQSAAVWFGSSSDIAPYRSGMTGFAILLAVITAGLALWQWKRPNRILPILGIAWGLYELSAFVTSALVGGPLGAEGVPTWSVWLSALAMGTSLILHIGGLRGAAALMRRWSA